MNRSRAGQNDGRVLLSGEDLIELSGIEMLHPGGLDLSRRIAGVVSFTPSTRVLDVSSGKGVFACLYAQEFGCTVTGIDIKEEFLDAARDRAQRMGVSGRVTFQAADSRQLPFPDGSFDVVVNECAVGLTAIGDPQQVLNEMVRVVRPGGKVIIHENTWLKELPTSEKEWAAAHIGTVPYSVQEWQQMLAAAGATPQITEDWSGIENLQKMRPGHKWSRHDPADFLGWREKLRLFPSLLTRYPLSSLVSLYRFGKRAATYIREGFLGYALIVASKS